MKLIDILVQELPKRGGWPAVQTYAWCDPDGEVRFDCDTVNDFYTIMDVDCNERGEISGDTRHKITREQYEAALKQSAWDGTGLPPVGVECERSWCGDKWLRCTVLFISDEMVVVKLTTGEACYRRDEVKFRPIRTERDEAIHEIASMIGRGTFYEDAERIYYAGYRKLSD